MKKNFVSLALGAASLLSACLIGTTSRAEDITIDGKAFRKISVAEYRDKSSGTRPITAFTPNIAIR